MVENDDGPATTKAETERDASAAAHGVCVLDVYCSRKMNLRVAFNERTESACAHPLRTRSTGAEGQRRGAEGDGPGCAEAEAQTSGAAWLWLRR